MSFFLKRFRIWGGRIRRGGGRRLYGVVEGTWKWGVRVRGYILVLFLLYRGYGIWGNYLIRFRFNFL